MIATVDSGAVVAQPEAPADESELASQVREVLERILEAISVRAQVEFREDGEIIVATLTGRELGLVIGKHGQTIDAIQYLVNAIVWRVHGEERKPIVIDAAGYRARRQASLDALAVRHAEEALSGGSPVELEPMTAVERKVVHERLKEFPGVSTQSEGTEPNRYVVIVPE